MTNAQIRTYAKNHGLTVSQAREEVRKQKDDVRPDWLNNVVVYDMSRGYSYSVSPETASQLLRESDNDYFVLNGEKVLKPEPPYKGGWAYQHPFNGEVYQTKNPEVASALECLLGAIIMNKTLGPREYNLRGFLINTERKADEFLNW